MSHAMILHDFARAACGRSAPTVALSPAGHAAECAARVRNHEHLQLNAPERIRLGNTHSAAVGPETGGPAKVLG